MLSFPSARAKHISTQEIKESPLWLIVLCDMMTNLMLFFLVMYAFTREPEEAKSQFLKGLESVIEVSGHETVDKIKSAKAVIDEQIASEKLLKAIKDSGLGNMAKIEVTEKKISLRMPASVLFTSGEAQLNQEARLILLQLNNILAGISNRIIVEGHTDNVPLIAGRYKTNWQLSIARADSVVEFLTRECRIDEKRFVIAGYGEFSPVAPNNSPDGRAKNRRIEIIIIRSEISGHGGA